MDVPTQNPDISFCRELFHSFSCKRCCLFLLLVITLIILASGIATLVVIFDLKPQKPIFTLQTVNIDSYKLDVDSQSTLLASSVVSVTLNAQNPNKVGIRYSPSRLHVLSEGLVIGLIRVPGFYQPAKSLNVSVQTRVFFECLNISRIISGVTPNGDVSMRILGDLKAHLWVFQIKLPNIKIALECDVDIDYRYLTFSKEVLNLKAAKNHLISFAANSQTFSNKCSISFYL